MADNPRRLHQVHLPRKHQDLYKTAGYSLLLDHGRNEDILELNTEPVKKRFAQYEQKLLNNVSRMDGIRHPKQLHDYQPVG
jgi:hypothetical protein